MTCEGLWRVNAETDPACIHGWEFRQIYEPLSAKSRRKTSASGAKTARKELSCLVETWLIGHYFLNKMANKKEVLAKIKKLLGLSVCIAITIGNNVTLKISAANINKQPIATQSLDKPDIAVSPLSFL